MPESETSAETELVRAFLDLRMFLNAALGRVEAIAASSASSEDVAKVRLEIARLTGRVSALENRVQDALDLLLDRKRTAVPGYAR